VKQRKFILCGFGFDKEVKDTKAFVSAVYVYPVDSKTSVNQSKPSIIEFIKDGSYLANKVVSNGK
jgi:hypothetical protein